MGWWVMIKWACHSKHDSEISILNVIFELTRCCSPNIQMNIRKKMTYLSNYLPNVSVCWWPSGAVPEDSAAPSVSDTCAVLRRFSAQCQPDWQHQRRVPGRTKKLKILISDDNDGVDVCWSSSHWNHSSFTLCDTGGGQLCSRWRVWGHLHMSAFNSIRSSFLN